MPQPLHHLRLPLTTYSQASRLQSILFNLHLLYKSQPPKSPSQPGIPQPPPYIITSSFRPIYTFGRRETPQISTSSVLKILKKGGSAAFTPRGGKVTFHGPGQIVAYPIIDLKQHNLSPRCYIRTLENAIIATLKAYHIKGFTTDEAGVWVRDDRKIASVGVNLRRWVTSHGLALNVDTDLEYFKRIVACGLPGVKMWSMKEQWKAESGFENYESGSCRPELRELLGLLHFTRAGLRREVEAKLVENIMERIGCEETKKMTVKMVEDLGEEYGLVGKGDGVTVFEYEDVIREGGLPRPRKTATIGEDILGVPGEEGMSTSPNEAIFAVGADGGGVEEDDVQDIGDEDDEYEYPDAYQIDFKNRRMSIPTLEAYLRREPHLKAGNIGEIRDLARQLHSLRMEGLLYEIKYWTDKIHKLEANDAYFADDCLPAEKNEGNVQGSPQEQ